MKRASQAKNYTHLFKQYGNSLLFSMSNNVRTLLTGTAGFSAAQTTFAGLPTKKVFNIVEHGYHTISVEIKFNPANEQTLVEVTKL